VKTAIRRRGIVSAGTGRTSRARRATLAAPRVREKQTKEGRIPSASYRLQLNSEFTFRDAAAIADYLHELGIMDCYASPIFQAAPHSTHGYDVCAFDHLNPELGGAGEFERFSDRLRQLGMGLVLDMVPNHMAGVPENPWWQDVLQNGRASPYASWFDIDWQASPDGSEKVLLPILDEHYAKVLEAGKLRVAFEHGKLVLFYGDRNIPLCAESRAEILNTLSSQARQRPDVSANLNEALPKFLDQINGKPGDPRSFDALDQLLRRQHYRLALWSVGSEEVNYRRFFDITELVSLRMELPEVFKATHRLVLQLLKSGRVNDLRIDHPDGLWNPKQYLVRLRAAFSGTGSGRRSPRAVRHPYVVVEKILTDDERLPADWPVDGTTGYDFLNRVNGLFIDSANGPAFDEIYAEFTGNRADFKSMVRASKLRILDTSLRSELSSLTRRLSTLARRSREGQDFTFRELRSALTQLIAGFPVYRTYITEDATEMSAADRDVILEAARNAPKSLALEFIQSLLLLNPPADFDQIGRKLVRDFVLRFQQLTGPVMAKGLEDTAFYNFNRLISLNEVGGCPDTFGLNVDAFHRFNIWQSENWPHSMLTTGTHDTKRGEDARARINVLSEMPAELRQTVNRWATLNAGAKRPVDGESAPCANDEYLLYQSLIGAWPHDIQSEADLRQFRERTVAYFQKALREAKAHTSWGEPHADYEEAAIGFAEQLFSNANPFLEDFKAFHEKINFFGKLNSLSQVLLKMTCPGVPDFYQGTELWDFSFVDPDNRRLVDYQLRRELLQKLKKLWHGDFEPPDSQVFTRFFDSDYSRAAKLFLIWRTLNFRLVHEKLFRDGKYIPLSVSGAKRDHVCAFARESRGQVIISVVPRLVFSLMSGAPHLPLGTELWLDTALEIPEPLRAPQYRDVFTGNTISLSADGPALVGSVLKLFPVALLMKAD
jgi:(1->4)-alpha-D-glucan 1-alpha-D-glucosylmutase